MITDWATVAEPVPSKTFVNPCYAVDIQILNSGKGIVLVTPDGTKLFRVYIDFDGAVATEFVNTFGGIPATKPLGFSGPFPVFGQVAGDLMILAAGAGILMPLGLSTSAFIPRLFRRLRMDNDGTPGTEPVTIGYWMRIPENSIPLALDVGNNWIFTQDIIITTPGQGIVMPMRGLSQTRRMRMDTDGAILTE